MRVRCLTSARFNMTADVLRAGIDAPPVEEEDNGQYGEWVEQQDPLTHEIIMVWVPAGQVTPGDNPDTPGTETQYRQQLSVPCLARGIVEGGIRVAGTTERFGNEYENIDYTRLWFPASVIITKRDRITNIRDSRGKVIWVDEETNPTGTSWRSTVFNVEGVTPIPDPFGRHVENQALLARAEVYA